MLFDGIGNWYWYKIQSDKEIWSSIITDTNEYPEGVYDSKTRQCIPVRFNKMLPMKVWFNYGFYKEIDDSEKLDKSEEKRLIENIYYAYVAKCSQCYKIYLMENYKWSFVCRDCPGKYCLTCFTQDLNSTALYKEEGETLHLGCHDTTIEYKLNYKYNRCWKHYFQKYKLDSYLEWEYSHLDCE